MPTVKGIIERVDGHVFDTVLFQGGHCLLFAVPVGQIALCADGPRMKGWTDTNMVHCGQLPAPQRILVNEITAAVLRDKTIVPLSDPIYRDTSIELSVGMKSYGRYALWQIADPKAVVLGKETRDQAIEAIDEFAKGASKLAEPIQIEQLECFSVEAYHDGVIDPPVELYVSLRGLLFRAVQ